MIKRTKIVCTLGPASEKLPTITKMVRAGMNVARLNFSHGTYKNHAMLIKNVRKTEKKTGEPVAIMQDIRGPKIRLGKLTEKGIDLKAGAMVTFDTGRGEYSGGIVPVDFPYLHEHVKVGERMLLDDGKIEVKVTVVSGTKVETNVVVGGILQSNKGINLPDTKLNIEILSEKDKADVKFGVEQRVDLIALSFVQNAKDILDLRFLIQEYEKDLGLKPEQPIRIIAKIERHEAVKNIDEILEVVDGIMVARGDLGIEVPAREVPLIQKGLIDKALAKAKPVIVATQMLDSMQHNPRPTRAEVSDVANAVIDHTDAVMLSNETAAGQYPVETVKTMADIIVEAEKSVYDNLPMRDYTEKGSQIDEVISQMSRLLAEHIDAKLILAASISGDSGRSISRYRPELPIVVGTKTERVLRQLNISWGVLPFILQPCRSIEELIERAILYLKKKKVVKKNDKIVVVAGEPVGHAGHVNLLEVREVK